MPKKILVVEDDKFLVRVYAKKLEKAGFDVVFTEDGAHVIDLIREQNPDIMLLDVVVPNEDGFTILDRLRDELKTKTPEVIVLSKLSQLEDIERGKKRDVRGYLIKTEHTFDSVLKTIQTLQ